MATPPRLFENNAYYHVYNRGNRKQQIFLTSRDYERFLEKVTIYKKKYPVNILSYCLMPNHFHFLIQQVDSGAISKLFSNLCNSHSKYFNVKYESVGTLFQGRFKSKVVDKDEYLIHLSRYIHLNPVSMFNNSGGLVLNQLFRYKWSSLPSYLFKRPDDIVELQTILSYFSRKNPSKDYENFVVSNIKIQRDPVIDHLAFEE